MTSYNWFNGKIIEQNIEGTILADDITADSVDSKVLKSNTGIIDITSNMDYNNNNIYNVDTLKVSNILKNLSDDNITIDELNILSGTLEYVDETNIYSLVNKDYVDNHAGGVGGLSMDEDGYLYNWGDYVQYMHIDEAFYADRIYTNAVYGKDGELTLDDNIRIENLNTNNIICQMITSLYGLSIGYDGDEENYAVISKFPFDDELMILNNVGDINITAEDGEVNINADYVNIENLNLIHGQIITPPSNQYDLVNKSYVDRLTPSTQYLIYNTLSEIITDNHNVPIQNLKLTTLETRGTINTGSHLSVNGRIHAENLLLSSDDTSGSPPVLNCPGYGYINKAVFDYATLTNVDNTDVNSLVNKAYVDSKISTRVKYDINIYSTLGDITSTAQPLIYQTENFNNIVKNTIYIPSSYIDLNIYEPTVLQISLPASITTIPENRGFINTISVDNLSTMSNPDYTNSYYYINNKILYIKSFIRNGSVNPYKNITVIDNIEISWFTS